MLTFRVVLADDLTIYTQGRLEILYICRGTSMIHMGSGLPNTVSVNQTKFEVTQ